MEEKRILPLKPFNSNCIKFILAFPDYYEYGLPNLAIQVLYRELYKIRDVLPDRYYLYTDDSKEKDKSLEYKIPLKEADIVGFSIPYEGVILNFIKMLDICGIPYKASQRQENDPIIVCGGPVVNYNPLPIAPFGDIFILGEGEELIKDLVNLCKNYKKNGYFNKKIFLNCVSQLRGCYVPAVHGFHGYGLIKQTKPIDINQFPSHSIFISKNTIYGEETFSIELRRGCNQRCRFCYMGTRLRPPRTLKESTFKDLVDIGLRYSRIIKLFYEGLAPEYVEQCLEYIRGKGGKVRIGSQRLDKLSERIIKIIGEAGQRKLTVAPETTERLRGVIGKQKIRNKDILKIVEISSNCGIPDFGLYFIIGLPFETIRDIDEIADFIMEVREKMNSLGNINGYLEIGINMLYPKPWTPFQYTCTILPNEAEERLQYLISKLSKGGYKVVVSTDVVDEKVERRKESVYKNLIKIETTIGTPVSFYQPIISRGGVEISEVIERVYMQGENTFESWKRALEESGIDYKKYFSSYIDYEKLPWEIQDCIISKEYLKNEYLNALAFKPTSECSADCKNCKDRCLGGI